MTRWWPLLVDRAAGLLDGRDRDAVRGDLDEAGVTGARALREILGLIVRRQLMSWTEWRPWVGLVALAMPLGFLLGAIARVWADTGAIYAWLYIDNWTSAYLDSAGSRAELVRTIAGFGAEALALAFTSWATGFVVTAFSARTFWAASALFGLALAAGFAAAPPRAPLNAVVFAIASYRIVPPLVAGVLLVAVPSVFGMRMARRHQEAS